MNSSCSLTLFVFAAVIFSQCLSSTGAATCHPDDEAGLLAFKSGITRDPSNILSSWKKGTDCCSWFGVNCWITDPKSNLTRLTWLNLGNNRLSGTIPDSLKSLTELETLNLGGNRLSGTIPDIFKSMTKLRDLGLDRNRLSGTLPPSLASLAPTLLFLDLSKNKLSGTIPDYFWRFKGLITLNLSRNRFSRVAPMSFANARFINSIDFSRNLLTGPFPALKEIDHMDLSYNQFNLKTIPKWVASSGFRSLKLAKCGIKMNFDDWRPVKTQNIVFIDFSENEISGSPAKFLNQTENMMEFKASGNKLRFDLEKLTFSKTMTTLDLSRNLVFGKVPATVAKLKKLYLSQNHLCGKLPVTKLPASVFAGNDCLCGPPLSPC